MRILIFGSGAIGSVLGGLLAEAGHEVTFLGRAWHLEVIRRQGLRISGIWGEHLVQPSRLITDVAELPPGYWFDWVFVCVKSHQTAAASRVLPSVLSPGTAVCAFQNGLGNYETLAKTVPPDRLALGRVIFGAELEPGWVRVTVCADAVLIGAPDPRVPRDAIERLVEALEGAGIPSRSAADILAALWGKVIYNCALNGLATVLEVPYGKLLEHEQARGLMEAVVQEAYRVAAAYRVRLEPATPEAYLERLLTRLIPDTAAHHASMLQDIARGHPTEIEALNGAIVRLGRARGIEAPVNALITRLVHAKERFLGCQSADGPDAGASQEAW